MPVEMPGWQVSSPADEGLDPKLVADLYRNAAELSSLYGLLVVKNGRLIAERYFNGGTLQQEPELASVTKSYTSALVGIALDRGCLSSLDQKMIDFFPEFADEINDARKEQITIGDMLKMQSGYPWEEMTPPYLDMLFSNNDWLGNIVEFPLTNDPGTQFGYSNLTAHLLGVIVARACDTDLLSFGQQYLFSPLNARVGAWPRDANGYFYGHGNISFTARDVVKFGLLYLNHGKYAGKQVLSADWVRDSLQTYSKGLYDNRLGYYVRDIGYGYMWWSATAGDHHFNYAWGHGGNLVILLDDLDMVVVTTANPLPGIWGEEAWKKEGAIIDLVGRFIKSIPTQPAETATPTPTTAVPLGTPSALDGLFSPGEWDRGLRQEFTDGGELILMQDGRYLYLGVHENFDGLTVTSVFLEFGDKISVLHSSGSLGTAVFKRGDGGWRLAQPFAWELYGVTSHSTGDEKKRQDFLAAKGWLANLGSMTDTEEIEYQIAIPNGPFRIAVAYLRPPRFTQAVWWPAELSDDCRNIDLLQGNTPEDLNTPRLLQFVPETWASFSLGNPEEK